MSFLDTNEDTTADRGFANGWTAFLTVQGLDIILRTEDGESKGRLAELNASDDLIGSITDPASDEEMQLTVTPLSEDELQLSCGTRTWLLERQPKGQFFAFMKKWPKKAEPAASVKAMLKGLKRK